MICRPGCRSAHHTPFTGEILPAQHVGQIGHFPAIPCADFQSGDRSSHWMMGTAVGSDRKRVQLFLQCPSLSHQMSRRIGTDNGFLLLALRDKYGRDIRSDLISRAMTKGFFDGIDNQIRQLYCTNVLTRQLNCLVHDMKLSRDDVRVRLAHKLQPAVTKTLTESVSTRKEFSAERPRWQARRFPQTYNVAVGSGASTVAGWI